MTVESLDTISYNEVEFMVFPEETDTDICGFRTTMTPVMLGKWNESKGKKGKGVLEWGF
jgi:hypothetical protein